MLPSPVVVKLGGSLFDLPDLRTRLQRWLEERRGQALVLVSGGGATADVIRDIDSRHALGEETAHWLALRALTLNAWWLSALLPAAAVTGRPADWPALWQRGIVPLLDAHAFVRADEGRPGCLPHCWSVTSDAVAARVAEVSGARHLVLLKSVTIPVGMDWAEAGRRGFVDVTFAEVVSRTPDLAVQAINFREECPAGKRGAGETCPTRPGQD